MASTRLRDRVRKLISSGSVIRLLAAHYFGEARDDLWLLQDDHCLLRDDLWLLRYELWLLRDGLWPQRDDLWPLHDNLRPLWNMCFSMWDCVGAFRWSGCCEPGSRALGLFPCMMSLEFMDRLVLSQLLLTHVVASSQCLNILICKKVSTSFWICYISCHKRSAHFLYCNISIYIWQNKAYWYILYCTVYIIV